MDLSRLSPMDKYTFVGAGAIYEIDQLCDKLGLGKNVLLIYDKITKKIAGDAIAEALSDYNVQRCLISNSDELNVEYASALIKKTKRNLVIGIGGGRSIDVAKAASYEGRIPWISVPTAISHDGFASSRASIDGRNGKESKKALSPIGLVGDINIIINSPQINHYAGIMDLLSNETAAYDCWLSAKRAGRKINHQAIEIAFACAAEILEHPKEFRNRTPTSISNLIDLGIKSGKAMQIAENSAPASGFEHKTSHALDKILKQPRMHGLQCGVGTLASKAAYEALDEDIEYPYETTKEAFDIIGLPVNYPALKISQKDVLKAYEIANKINTDRFTIGNLVEECKMPWQKILKGRKII